MQWAEPSPCGPALATQVAGGVLIVHRCGFETFRPGAGVRWAGWGGAGVPLHRYPSSPEQFISDRLPGRQL